MFKIESELKMSSTFYFRWKTMNREIMEDIHSRGFEVSLHYETLATYCKKHHIKEAKKITDAIMKICFDELQDEIKKFRTQFWDIQTIASHGDKRNRILGIPNQVILKYGNRADLNIQFEAYDPEITKIFDAYISDSSITNNFNWKYGLTPQEAIHSRLNTICLLTHPEHWNFNFKKNMRTIITDICERLS
jgi:hypothetical protein